MEFKLNLVANRPTAGELVLTAEVPLSGVKFIETFGQAMRKSIDHVGRHRHITLGSVAMYEITVPQQMAIESGLFEAVDTVAVYVENGLLNNYIFYSASMSYGKTGRPCYPYMQNEATLVSMVDELSFLNDWAGTGYATTLCWRNGVLADVNASYDNGGNTGTEEDTSNGGIGCDGCTCDHDHFHHHPGHYPPPPPRPSPAPAPKPEPDYQPPIIDGQGQQKPPQKPSRPTPPPKPNGGRPVPPPRPQRPGPRPVKPDVPPGYDPGDDCFCDDVWKPGTIILDPVEGVSEMK